MPAHSIFIFRHIPERQSNFHGRLVVRLQICRDTLRIPGEAGQAARTETGFVMGDRVGRQVVIFVRHDRKYAGVSASPPGS